MFVPARKEPLVSQIPWSKLVFLASLRLSHHRSVMPVDKYFLQRRQAWKNSTINSRTLSWVKLAELQSHLVWKKHLWDLHHPLETYAKGVRCVLFSNVLLLSYIKLFGEFFPPSQSFPVPIYPFPRKSLRKWYLSVWNIQDSASFIVQEGQGGGHQPPNWTNWGIQGSKVVLKPPQSPSPSAASWYLMEGFGHRLSTQLAQYFVQHSQRKATDLTKIKTTSET